VLAALAYFQAATYFSTPSLVEYILHVFFVVTAFLVCLSYAMHRNTIRFAKRRKK